MPGRMAPLKKPRNTPRLPLALNPLKSKDVLAVLAERNHAVVPIGAWVEPASPHSSEMLAYTSACVIEEELKEQLRKKQEALKHFQTQVKHRVNQRVRLRKKQQLQRSYEAAEKKGSIAMQSSDPAHLTPRRRTSVFPNSLNAAVGSSRLPASPEDGENQNELFQQQAQALSQTMKQVRHRLASFKTMGKKKATVFPDGKRKSVPTQEKLDSGESSSVMTDEKWRKNLLWRDQQDLLSEIKNKPFNRVQKVQFKNPLFDVMEEEELKQLQLKDILPRAQDYLPEAQSDLSETQGDLPGIHSVEPEAENVELDTQAIELEVQAREPETQAGEPEAQASEPESQPCEPESQPCEPEAQPCEPEAQSREPEAQPCEPEAQSGEPEAQSGEPEAQAGEPETQAGETETQGGTLEAHSIEPEDGSIVLEAHDFLPPNQGFLPKDQDFLPKDQNFLSKEEDFLLRDQSVLLKDQSSLPKDQNILPKCQDQNFVPRDQRQKQYLRYKRLFMDMEREQVKEQQRQKEHKKKIEKIKKKNEQERYAEEQRILRMTCHEEPYSGENMCEILAQLQLEEIKGEREKQKQREKEYQRYVEALRVQIQDKMRLYNITLPPLCCCGPDFWDAHPDTCANNCIFYKNPRAYTRALHSVISSCDIPEGNSALRIAIRNFASLHRWTLKNL
ncbi:coiled-coil domain-containing protein 15 isoform 2-T2 [Dugong dugon]